MADERETKGLKSTGRNRRMRSRGFLSHPGGQPRSTSDVEGAGREETKHHRSRGARQNSASTDGRPRDLTVKPDIKPYRLDQRTSDRERSGVQKLIQPKELEDK